MWCCYACIRRIVYRYIHTRKEKSFHNCSYVKVIKIFDKVLSKVAQQWKIFDVFRFLFFCLSVVGLDMFTIKQTFALCPLISWHANRYRYFDTLRWRDFSRKIKVFPKLFRLFFKTFWKLAMHNPLYTERAYHCEFACLFYPAFRPIVPGKSIVFCARERATILQFLELFAVLGFLGCIFSSPLYSGKEQQCLLYLFKVAAASSSPPFALNELEKHVTTTTYTLGRVKWNRFKGGFELL